MDARRTDPAEVGIWALSAAMILVALGLLAFGGVADARAELTAPALPLWALLPAFALAEVCVVHVHFRRSAHSLSLGEIPLVLGLVFAGGGTVVLAYALGRGAVLALVRRLPAIRLVFNLGQFLLGGTLAVLVFHAVAPGAASGVDGRVGLAAGAATATASALAVLMISVAVTLTEGRRSPRSVALSLASGLVVALALTCIAVCAAHFIHRDWRIELLLAVPVVGMAAAMRAYAGERRRHGRLEFLYETARELAGAADLGSALQGVLGRAVEEFRAELGEIVVLSPDGARALRTAVSAGGDAVVLAPVDPDPVRLARGEGISVPLTGERGVIGSLTIRDPSGVVDAFDAADAKLLETLAANVAVVLENDRLGQTVWEMRRRQDDLAHQASHDPLTDLANRALFAERLDRALVDGGHAAVIYIDVNDFKLVNDTLGHAAGDELLLAIAGRLSECVRPADTLARLGGDEFAILLAGRGCGAAALEVAARIDGRMVDPVAIAGHRRLMRLSAGIASAEGSAVSAETLIASADAAMYRVKQETKLAMASAVA